MNSIVTVLCYGHYFQIKCIPTESTEAAYRRAWWIVSQRFNHPDKNMDDLWVESFHTNHIDTLYDFEQEEANGQ